MSSSTTTPHNTKGCPASLTGAELQRKSPRDRDQRGGKPHAVSAMLTQGGLPWPPGVKDPRPPPRGCREPVTTDLHGPPRAHSGS